MLRRWPHSSRAILICSVLQCVVVCCRVTVLVTQHPCVAVCFTVLYCGAFLQCWPHSTRAILLFQSVAVCCSVLQCVAVCCSVLQCVAIQYHWPHRTRAILVLQCVAVCCSALQYGAVLYRCPHSTRAILLLQCCSVLQCIVMWCTGAALADLTAPEPS